MDMFSLWLPLRGAFPFPTFRVLTTFMAINETTTSTMMSASENCERFSTVITIAHILVILPMGSAFMRASSIHALLQLLHLLLLLDPCVLMAASCQGKVAAAQQTAQKKNNKIWSMSMNRIDIFLDIWISSNSQLAQKHRRFYATTLSY